MSVCTAIDIGIPPQLTLPTGLTNISWLLYVWEIKLKCKFLNILIMSISELL